MATAPRSLNGVTLTGATSSWTATIIDITPPTSERDSLATSNQATTGYMTFLAAKLSDPGSIEMTVEWEGAEADPTLLVDENWAITWPGHTATQAGHFTAFGGGNGTLGEKMTSSGTLKLSGPRTVVTNAL